MKPHLGNEAAAGAGQAQAQHQQQVRVSSLYMQPNHKLPPLRNPNERPIALLSIHLIETYKKINKAYYAQLAAERLQMHQQHQKHLHAHHTNNPQAHHQPQQQLSAQAGHHGQAQAQNRKLAQEGESGQEEGATQQNQSQQQTQAQPQGQAQANSNVNNNGWDDEHYDYVFTMGEVINDRYVLEERIGKGSFGQVVKAFDKVSNEEVAIKIVKSKKPFLIQSQTETELLMSLSENAAENNIVRLYTHFMYRNHQCLVFEMLSLNLYELLKNTQFCGVSQKLIRKFAKQILKTLRYLKRVDIIHCDLKPENILLCNPKRSGIKVIDFGSSCKSHKRMYSYIQSRFYRSPEVMLGLRYTQAIDMWSLGCILVEMHTGEPLFSGNNQFGQMFKIVELLGMPPPHIIEMTDDKYRTQFFKRDRSVPGGWSLNTSNNEGSNNNSGSSYNLSYQNNTSPREALLELIQNHTNRTKKYPPNTQQTTTTLNHQVTSQNANLGGAVVGGEENHQVFADFISKMLTFDPEQRITPIDALQHPFIADNSTIQNLK